MFRSKADLNEIIPEYFQEGFEKSLAAEGDIWLPRSNRVGKMIVRPSQVEVLWERNGIPSSQMGLTVDYVNENSKAGIEMSEGIIGHFALRFEQQLQRPVMAGLSRLAVYGTVFQENL